MRIIAGEFRGRTLVEPKFDTTRPITDRAKQSLFDVLAPLLPDAVVYDCFCGTGSMGLECLSRGAAAAYFFDADRAALTGLKTNIDALRVGDRAKVYGGDLFKLAPTAEPPRPVDLLFLDPPYRFLNEKPEPLRALADRLRSRLADDAVVLFRHDSADTLALPGFVAADVRVYGSMTIELLRQG